MFLMLNPSTADAEKDDPTIRRCIGFAKREGRDGIIVINIFAYRTSDPKKLREAFENGIDVIGPDNKKHVMKTAMEYGEVVCAWGSSPIAEDMEWFSVRDLWACGVKTYDLGRTKAGPPRHPLYVRADQPLLEYAPRP